MPNRMRKPTATLPDSFVGGALSAEIVATAEPWAEEEEVDSPSHPPPEQRG